MDLILGLYGLLLLNNMAFLTAFQIVDDHMISVTCINCREIDKGLDSRTIW